MILRQLIKKWRLHNEISLRDLAEQIGIDPSTLHRFESGQEILSDTLGMILKWALSTEAGE